MRRSETETKASASWLKLSQSKQWSAKQREELEKLAEQHKQFADKLRVHAFAIIGAPFAEPKTKAPKPPKAPKPKKEPKPKRSKTLQRKGAATVKATIKNATKKAWQTLEMLKASPKYKPYWREGEHLFDRIGPRPRGVKAPTAQELWSYEGPEKDGSGIAVEALARLYRLTSYLFPSEPKEASLWKDRLTNLAALMGVRSKLNVSVAPAPEKPKQPAMKAQGKTQEARKLKSLRTMHSRVEGIERSSVFQPTEQAAMHDVFKHLPARPSRVPVTRPFRSRTDARPAFEILSLLAPDVFPKAQAEKFQKQIHFLMLNLGIL